MNSQNKSSMNSETKLMITVTTANSWIYPEARNWATNVDELIDDVVKCYEAGAAIGHVHLIQGHEKEIVDRIRDRCDIIIQAGMSSDSIADRQPLFEAHPDMASIILNHHDESFTQLDVYRLHTREELEQYCKLCDAYRIKPEWEVWNTGSLWNLNYLIKKGLLSPPYFLSSFFNWPGGAWSPPEPEEFFLRKRYYPPQCLYTASTMGPEQTKIATLAILHEGHVRVGTEDYPYIKQGIPAKDNAEIVARMVRISRELGREVATPSEARKIIDLK
ncbi:MAG: 3-keto-5-aminohexanoate cleavage protein [Promethearchaeota archaeon]|nr:MAG: 3-keto-5-aminohexanoate cleavage protein [Candidatus Lokiarchaeota archaeon]